MILCHLMNWIYWSLLRFKSFYDDMEENVVLVIPDYSQFYNEYYYARKLVNYRKFKQIMDVNFKRILLDLEKLNQHGYTDIVIKL